MTIKIFTIITLLILAITGIVANEKTKDKKIQNTEAIFPTVEAANLEGRKYSLPKDFEGERNILTIAFQREQQNDIDTWTPLVKELTAKNSSLHYYELPTIGKFAGMFRGMINGGMRKGIPDINARNATITLYLDKATFRKGLKLGDEKRIYILVVDRQGKVLWRNDGVFSKEKGEALAKFLG
jgi:ATP10 protein